MQPLDEGAEAARGSVSTLELPCMRMHAYAHSALLRARGCSGVRCSARRAAMERGTHVGALLRIGTFCVWHRRSTLR